MLVENALTRLNILINSIAETHREVNERWNAYASSNGIGTFNQKSMQVIDIEANNLMPFFKEYTSFLRNCDEISQFDDADPQFTVNARVKNVNSIEEKYKDYMSKDENGKVSINKCYNDLFGIRAIVDCQDLSHEIIEEQLSREGILIERKDDRHKTKPLRYRATHIYFKSDNKSFRWELQVWRSQDEECNQNSHMHHRFRYREWESQTKSKSVKGKVKG